MSKYIIDKGALIIPPPQWMTEYAEGEDAIDRREAKHQYLIDQSYSNAEYKALMMAICGGSDPTGSNAGDRNPDEDNEEG